MSDRAAHQGVAAERAAQARAAHERASHGDSRHEQEREREIGAAAASLPAPERSLRAVVVVPARDEAQRIAACLVALASQLELVPASYETIVVLDGCRDETARVVSSFHERHESCRLHAIELERPVGVGRARRVGMDVACERLLAVGRTEGLIASTDADSVVAPDWLARQLELVGEGARAIGGLIALHGGEAGAIGEAVAERDARARMRMAAVLAASAEQASAVEHHHFSGASLSLTAETYRRCGGLPVRAALEDEALEAELRARGVPIHRSRTVRVTTSARLDGRAPRGLARDLARSNWRVRRCYTAEQFPLERLLTEKRCSISLVLPARQVAGTIGRIAREAAMLRDAGLLDEVLVVDSSSGDGTAEIARAEGLDVVQEDELAPELGFAVGKGDAMWRALRATAGEIVAFADTDTEQLDERFLTGLVGPLVCDEGVQFVKGRFRRPFRSGDSLDPHGGGRVTELMARPLLNLHAPELAVFDQPLAGETAARRALLERVPFSAGYGVEIAMLIDCWRLVGLDAMAQVDLGVRQNRHQPLRDLSAMAYAVLVAAEARLLGTDCADRCASGSIVLPPLASGQPMEVRSVSVLERPALSALQLS
ncbi:MAG: glucosyl-3-phosphoglycerate synthase [Solirubrobacteraceae bacterium]